jgi:hypothetical protein
MFGTRESFGGLAAHGIASSASLSERAPDSPAPGVIDEFTFTASGHGAFRPAADLDSAIFDLATPVSTGSLTFTAGTGCPAGIRARNGTVSGSFTVTDPVLGPITVTGAEMGTANLAIVDAEAYKCAGQDGV